MSMGDERVVVSLYFVRETPAARCFQEHEKQKDVMAKQLWIPRSLIREMTKYPAPDTEYPQCDITLPKWKAEELNLDYEE